MPCPDWTVHTNVFSGFSAVGRIAWSPTLGLFCTARRDVGPSTTFIEGRIYTSPDGVNWTVSLASEDILWAEVAWSPTLEVFVAIGAIRLDSSEINNVAVSSDGITWQLVSTPSRGWGQVVWSDALGLFCAHTMQFFPLLNIEWDSATPWSMVSPDGLTWTEGHHSIFDNAATASLAFSESIGLFVVAPSNFDTNDGVLAISSDGLGWDQVYQPVSETNQRFVAVDELHMIVGTSGAIDSLIISEDGEAWHEIGTGLGNNFTGLSWAPEIGLLVANGISTDYGISEDALHSWQPCSAAFGETSGVPLTWAPELNMFVGTRGFDAIVGAVAAPEPSSASGEGVPADTAKRMWQLIHPLRAFE